MTFSYYYRDPDGNHVELQIDNFGDWAKSSAFMREAPEFHEDPIGKFVDPDRVAAAARRRARASRRSTPAPWPASSRRTRRRSRRRRWRPSDETPIPRDADVMSTMAAAARPAPTGARAASRAALEVLLTDAAIEPGAVGRLVQPATARGWPAVSLAARRRVARRVGGARRRAGADRGRQLRAGAAPRATAASATAPGRTAGCSTG